MRDHSFTLPASYPAGVSPSPGVPQFAGRELTSTPKGFAHGNSQNAGKQGSHFRRCRQGRQSSDSRCWGYQDGALSFSQAAPQLDVPPLRFVKQSESQNVQEVPLSPRCCQRLVTNQSPSRRSPQAANRSWTMATGGAGDGNSRISPAPQAARKENHVQ